MWRNAPENGAALQEKALVSPRSSGGAGISPQLSHGLCLEVQNERSGKAEAPWVPHISPEEGVVLSAFLCGPRTFNLH